MAKFAKWQEQVTTFVSEAQDKCAACKDETELEAVFSQAIALTAFSYAAGMNQELQQRSMARLEAVKFTAKVLLSLKLEANWVVKIADQYCPHLAKIATAMLQIIIYSKFFVN